MRIGKKSQSSMETIEWGNFSPGGITMGLLKAYVRHQAVTVPSYLSNLMPNRIKSEINIEWWIESFSKINWVLKKSKSDKQKSKFYLNKRTWNRKNFTKQVLQVEKFVTAYHISVTGWQLTISWQNTMLLWQVDNQLMNQYN